jgi:uncharacterized protein (TIGR00269 family)
MRKCDKCPEESIIHIQYSGANLCKKHFAEYVERRVQKEIRLQGKLPARAKLAIAVSGGKDSMSMLHILNRVFASHRDVELIALIVDEGLAGYRERAIKLATDFSEKLGIRHEVLSFQESFGVRPDDIAALGEEWRPCTYCGVLRRNLLNRRARELGVEKIAFGHNLDDMSQSVLMNIVNGDIQRLVRLGPHRKVQEGLVPRMLPLRIVPESEMKLYADIMEIPYLDMHCFYRPRAHRLGFLEMIDSMERDTPGTRHSILSSYDQMIPALRERFPPAKLNACKKCGEPTMGDICKACELLDKVRAALE